jgi:chemotaxis protein MotB
MRGIHLFAEAALTAALLCGCVSVAEHEALRKQLAVEQARVREQEERMRELGLAVRKQRNQLRVARLERDEAREKLSLAEAALPVVVADTGGGQVESVLAGAVSFAPGSQKLTDADLAQLGEIAGKVTARGYTEILVEGHSDPTPLSAGSPFQSNMHLSTVRALAVYHAIIEMPDVEPARVRVVGHGEFGLGRLPAPRASRQTGRKPGRRVEIRYVPAASGGPDRATKKR